MRLRLSSSSPTRPAYISALLSHTDTTLLTMKTADHPRPVVDIVEAPIAVPIDRSIKSHSASADGDAENAGAEDAGVETASLLLLFPLRFLCVLKV